jgi:hypothetical protein
MAGAGPLRGSGGFTLLQIIAVEASAGLAFLAALRLDAVVLAACTIVTGHRVDPIEPRNDGLNGYDLGGPGVDDAAAAYGQPELGAPGASPQRLRQPLENVDGTQDQRRRGPEIEADPFKRQSHTGAHNRRAIAKLVRSNCQRNTAVSAGSLPVQAIVKSVRNSASTNPTR